MSNQCQAVTLKNKQCENKIRAGEYCSTHANFQSLITADPIIAIFDTKTQSLFQQIAEEIWSPILYAMLMNIEPFYLKELSTVCKTWSHLVSQPSFRSSYLKIWNGRWKNFVPKQFMTYISCDQDHCLEMRVNDTLTKISFNEHNVSVTCTNAVCGFSSSVLVGDRWVNMQDVCVRALISLGVWNDWKDESCALVIDHIKWSLVKKKINPEEIYAVYAHNILNNS